MNQEHHFSHDLSYRLRLLDILDQISQISLASGNMEDVLSGVLDLVLEVFNADRAWFLFPCDPDAPSWGVPMERTVPEWPGLFAMGVEIPMSPEVAELFREQIRANRAIQYGPAAEFPVPASVTQQFSVQSQLQIVLQTKIGKAWMFGLHHCSRAVKHNEDEIRLFTAIAQRISDTLSGLISIRQLRDSEEKFRNLFQSSPVGLFHATAEGRLLLANPAIAAMLGYASPDELIAQTSDMGAQIHAIPQQRAEMLAAMQETEDWVHRESSFRRKDGAVIAVNMTVRKVLNPDGSVACFEGFVEDITQKKFSQELIWRQANFDPLTELPNRYMFHDRLQQEIKKADQGRYRLTLLLVDLDRFKEVNDTLGHYAGDTLLKAAAQCISRCVLDTDTVARLGGDEFTITLTGTGSEDRADKVAHDIIQALSEPFHLNSEVVYISASVGITMYPDDATEVENLLKNADQAMYAAKNDGRNRYGHFTPSLQEAAQRRQNLIRDLRGALAADQFRVYFQPIVELATGRIFKAEALLRWQHPTKGMIAPSEFIPLAEDTGLIVEIGEWVFRQAAAWAKRWNSMVENGFQISVNKSPVQFHAADSQDNWIDHLHTLGLTGSNIAVEITEGLMLDADVGVTNELLRLRDVGIQVAIDDFGTGYSSLAYLKKFDIDYLKIDQVFVCNLATDPTDMALSRAAVLMAHELGLKVIAEGIETEAQRELLTAMGCDFGQGYLFSRPIPPEQFESLLAENWQTQVEKN